VGRANERGPSYWGAQLQPYRLLEFQASQAKTRACVHKSVCLGRKAFCAMPRTSLDGAPKRRGPSDGAAQHSLWRRNLRGGRCILHL